MVAAILPDEPRPPRCFRCCRFFGGSAARRGVAPLSPRDGPSAEAAAAAPSGFQPSCTCQGFVRDGACRHLAPPGASAPPAPAGRVDTNSSDTDVNGVPVFSPSCSCQAFRAAGMCRHLLPPAPPGVPSPGGSDNERGTDDNRGGTLPELDLPPLGLELAFEEVLGRGASGATVFRCTATPTGASSSAASVPCAAKVLPLTPSTFADMVEEFGDEVHLARGLRHPGLVGFLGAGKIRAPPALGDLPGVGPEGADAYVMCVELCDTALESVIRQRRREKRHFANEEMGPLLAQVASGLGHLHACGVLHRDIKAANVFIQRRPCQQRSEAADGPQRAEKCDGGADAASDGKIGVGACEEAAAEAGSGQAELCPPAEAAPASELLGCIAKLGDFGASKACSRAQTPVQTPQWMAPEVVRQEGYGRPADIWALGMLIFELLELSVPFGDDVTLPELEAELAAGRPPRLSDSVAQRAPALAALMRRCLAAAPSERPTAAEVCESLAASGWTPPSA